MKTEPNLISIRVAPHDESSIAVGICIGDSQPTLHICSVRATQPDEAHPIKYMIVFLFVIGGCVVLREVCVCVYASVRCNTGCASHRCYASISDVMQVFSSAHTSSWASPSLDEGYK